MTEEEKNAQNLLTEDAVFALDIGTRSIIGLVGIRENDKIHVVAIEQAEHTKRAMVDGQIEDIDQVSRIAGQVKKKLEDRLSLRLDRVCVAAAGRALKTQKATYELELPEIQRIDEEVISRLEAGAISQAEEAFDSAERDGRGRKSFYLVGYSVIQYYLDDYLISNLKDHNGKRLKIDIIATFLPSEVVDSLYAAMNKTHLEIASLTLEPIAAINAAIPENLRLLNLALVDIGAGTSDIAVCRDGSVIGYTMATVAGDEITEHLMKEYLIDFQTAEMIKSELAHREEIIFTDILGFEQTISVSHVMEAIQDITSRLCREISEKILEVNGGKPSAVFLAGGGSKLMGLLEGIVEQLGIDPKRVAIAGNNFRINACSDSYDLNNPEYATPLGIAISAGLNLVNDSFFVKLNGMQAKLFRSGTFTVRDILMMNGYTYKDMVGKKGQNLMVMVNGERMVFYGSSQEPAQLFVNNKEGRLSDIVHAGDSILFTPAQSGRDAQVFLSELPGAMDPAVSEVKVNGIKVTSDIELRNGAVITYCQQTARSGPLEDAAVENGERDNSGETTDNVPKSSRRKAPKNTPEPAHKEITEETIKDTIKGTLRDAKRGARKKATSKEPAELQPNDAGQLTIKFEESGAADQKRMPAPPPVQKAKPAAFSVTLNDKPCTFPLKADESPYYLMDMLQHSGLDFDHIKGNVILTVNGQSSSFQQVLEDGDKIEIYDSQNRVAR